MKPEHKVVLVTGATGFLGANLVEALNYYTDWHVRALHRYTSSLDALRGLSYEPVEGDILDSQSLLEAMRGCYAVFHVAGIVTDYWKQDVEELRRVNVDGTRNVVDAALTTGVARLIYTSSQGALGFPDGTEPIDESHQFNIPPDTFPYGHSKYLAEQEVRDGIERGLDAVIVNPTVPIGPHDVNLYISRIILETFRGRALFVPPGGINVVDVGDVAQGHIMALEKGRRGERYLLGGHNITNLELIKKIAIALGVRPPIGNIPRSLVQPLAWLIDIVNSLSPYRLPLSGDILRMGSLYFYADRRKAADELGLPLTPLKDTIERSIEWLREENHLY